MDKNASSSDIKKAYYSLAKKYHPDTNKDPGAKDRFSEAQSSYEILSDPKKKETWDQYGAAAFDQGAGFDPSGGAGAGGGGGPFGGGFKDSVVVVVVALGRTSILRTFSGHLPVVEGGAGVKEGHSNRKYWLVRTSRCRPTSRLWMQRKGRARTSLSHRLCNARYVMAEA